MADYSKDLYDYTYECMKNCSAFDDGYNQALDNCEKIIANAHDNGYIDSLLFSIISANFQQLRK